MEVCLRVALECDWVVEMCVLWCRFMELQGEVTYGVRASTLSVRLRALNHRVVVLPSEVSSLEMLITVIACSL